MLRFEFMDGPWENSELPTIFRDSPTGGDPHILAVLKRVHDPAALHELCALANEALEARASLRTEVTELVEWLERTRDERLFPAHLLGWCDEAQRLLVALVPAAEHPRNAA